MQAQDVYVSHFQVFLFACVDLFLITKAKP